MKQQDPALKQVLQEQEDIRLSPNFCYRTLQRVEELARQRRQREERRFFRAIVATAACLAAGPVHLLRREPGRRLREPADGFHWSGLFSLPATGSADTAPAGTGPWDAADVSVP